MKLPTREEQRKLVKQWAETGRILDEMRLKALRDKPYDWQEVDALLELGDYYTGPRGDSSGLIEMQRIFMRHEAYQKWRKARENS